SVAGPTGSESWVAGNEARPPDMPGGGGTVASMLPSDRPQERQAGALSGLAVPQARQSMSPIMAERLPYNRSNHEPQARGDQRADARSGQVGQPAQEPARPA